MPQPATWQSAAGHLPHPHKQQHHRTKHASLHTVPADMGRTHTWRCFFVSFFVARQHAAASFTEAVHNSNTNQRSTHSTPIATAKYQTDFCLSAGVGGSAIFMSAMCRTCTRGCNNTHSNDARTICCVLAVNYCTLMIHALQQRLK